MCLMADYSIHASYIYLIFMVEESPKPSQTPLTVGQRIFCV